MNNREIQFFLTLRDEATKKWEQFQGQVASGTNKITQTFNTIKTALAGAFAVGILKSFSDAAMQNELSMAKTAAVIKSTGGVAGMTANDIKNLSDQLSDMSGVSHDVVQSGANVMLTFTAIGKDIFPQAMEAALNMSAALGDDLQSNIIRLGKALQDPVLGMTALRRVGVNISQDFKNTVKAMVAVGDVAGAQKYIIHELNVEFGGMAKAVGDTTAGQMNKLENSIRHVKETLGEIVNNVLTVVMPTLRTLTEAFASLPISIQAVTFAVGGLTIAIGLMNAAWLLSPITWIILGVVAALTLLTATSAEDKKALQEQKEAIVEAENATASYKKTVEGMTKAQREEEIRALTVAIRLQTEQLIHLGQTYGYNAQITIDANQALSRLTQGLVDAKNAMDKFDKTTQQAWNSQKNYDDGLGKLRDDLKGLTLNSDAYIAKLQEIFRKESDLKALQESASTTARLKNEATDRQFVNKQLGMSSDYLHNMIPLQTQNMIAANNLSMSFIKAGQAEKEMTAFQKVVQETGQMIQSSLDDGYRTFASDIVDYNKNIGDSFTDMINGMIKDMERYALEAVAKGLFGVVTGGIGSLFSSIFHQGGVVPKAHDGAYINAPANKEFPILVRGGETVRTEKQEAALDNNNGATVHVHINAPGTTEDMVRKAVIEGLRRTGLKVDKYLVDTSHSVAFGNA